MKNPLSKINSRLDITEFLKISELEDTPIELYKLKHKGGKKKLENMQRASAICEMLQGSNVRVIGVPEDRLKKKWGK